MKMVRLLHLIVDGRLRGGLHKPLSVIPRIEVRVPIRHQKRALVITCTIVHQGIERHGGLGVEIQQGVDDTWDGSSLVWPRPRSP